MGASEVGVPGVDRCSTGAATEPPAAAYRLKLERFSA